MKPLICRAVWSILRKWNTILVNTSYLELASRGILPLLSSDQAVSLSSRVDQFDSSSMVLHILDICSGFCINLISHGRCNPHHLNASGCMGPYFKALNKVRPWEEHITTSVNKNAPLLQKRFSQKFSKWNFKKYYELYKLIKDKCHRFFWQMLGNLVNKNNTNFTFNTFPPFLLPNTYMMLLQRKWKVGGSDIYLLLFCILQRQGFLCNRT